MEIQEGKSEKANSRINKTAVLVAVILGLAILGYGYMNISYKNKVFEAEQAYKNKVLEAEQAEKQAEKAKEAQEKGVNQLLLDACLQDTETNYTKNWKSNCEARRLKEDCSLPADLAESLENNRSKFRDECFKKYPVE